jgi:hypothetical protein
LASFDVYRNVVTGIILRSMRRLWNWTYRDVTAFLKVHGLSYQEPLKGSHQRWTKPGENGGPDRQVEIHLPRDSYQPKTLKSMIRQSGIAVEEWLKWAGS